MALFAGSRDDDWSRTLGCIADDLTGATDLANALTRAGVETTLLFGLPLDIEDGLRVAPGAVVVALAVRSSPAEEARAAVRQAVQTLQGLGVQHFYSKYCSTFDSTDAGNIGPVADELLGLLGGDQFVHAPTYPENGRTVYQGHLFVGTQPLDESPLRDHPLNPMTDANLSRVLQRQTSATVGLLPWQEVAAGRARARLEALLAAGVTHVIADAITKVDLDAIADDLGGRLAGGGAPFGASLARALGASSPSDEVSMEGLRMPARGGRSAVVAGSASRATRGQIAAFEGPVAYVSPADLAAGTGTVDEIADWAGRRLDEGPVLVAAEDLAGAGSEPVDGKAAAAMEQALADVAVRLVSLGVERLVVAGGETSGAVARALGLRRVQIGPEICPGVPWCLAPGGLLAVAFKSGNFGAPTFFADALEILDRSSRE